MQTVTAPGANARTFLIHMFRRGLDDNRYVVERYKSTFDGEIVRWPGKGKSKTRKQPRQVMSLGAVQRMRPERDEIMHRREDRRLRHPVLGILCCLGSYVAALTDPSMSYRRFLEFAGEGVRIAAT